MNTNKNRINFLEHFLEHGSIIASITCLTGLLTTQTQVSNIFSRNPGVQPEHFIFKGWCPV